MSESKQCAAEVMQAGDYFLTRCRRKITNGAYCYQHKYMMTYQKLLFLDIDGVVNRSGTRERIRGGNLLGFEPVLVERVRRIIKETGCSVVLSSAWRCDAQSRQDVRSGVCNFIDWTPNYPHAIRGEEIRTWILDNVPREQLKAYAILDDDSDFYAEQPLFQTSWLIGITDEIADRVIAHLNVKN